MNGGTGEERRCQPEEARARLGENPLRWLGEEPTYLWKRKKKAQEKAETRAREEKRKAEAEAAKADEARRAGWVRFRSGRKLEFRVPDICRKADDSSGSKDDGGKKPEDKLASGIWKVVGAVATGITATGAIVAIGAAVIWIRFNAVGIPATQAVSVQPKGEPLVLGAQETITFVGIALLAVLLVYFADPSGVIRRITLVLFSLLAAFAIVYVICGTHLTGESKFLLCLLAVALFAGAVAVGHRTEQRFWPLALAVFVSSLVFAGAVGILVVKQQKFVQGVAILREGNDAGLTGVYVAATDSTIYFAEKVARKKDKKSRMAMLEVPRKGTTYAVGPLEPREDAAERETLMLEVLIANRERAALPVEKAKEPETDLGAKAPKKASGKSESAEIEGKTVAEAFGEGAVTVHETVVKPWDCLVRYASAGSRLLGKWWTSCRTAEELERAGSSMLALRSIFALPSRFQIAYDMRVQARLPLGAEVTYMTGPVAPQCEHAKQLPCGYEWKGGFLGRIEQVYLPEPQLVEGPRRRCTETRIDLPPDWADCEAQG